jgi:hypothetical protein
VQSPFPGMDPYLEARWGDIHSSLCTYAKEVLQPLLPEGLRARTEEEVLVERDVAGTIQEWIPDASIIEDPTRIKGVGSRAAGVVVAPLIVDQLTAPRRHWWINIVDSTRQNRVVTAIEFLSVSNKRAGKTNRKYRKNLSDYAKAGVNLVEIDLIRKHDRGCRFRKAICRRTEGKIISLRRVVRGERIVGSFIRLIFAIACRRLRFR